LIDEVRQHEDLRIIADDLYKLVPVFINCEENRVCKW